MQFGWQAYGAMPGGRIRKPAKQQLDSGGTEIESRLGKAGDRGAEQVSPLHVVERSEGHLFGDGQPSRPQCAQHAQADHIGGGEEGRRRIGQAEQGGRRRSGRRRVDRSQGDQALVGGAP